MVISVNILTDAKSSINF